MAVAEVQEAGGSAPPSPAGPVEDATMRMPPGLSLSKFAQTVRFGMRPLSFSVKAQRRLGDVFQVRLLSRDEPIVVTTHPDHVKSLFTAKPDDAPSLTGESPLRPVLGPNSVLTLTGDRHMEQRKRLLPPFHGDAVARYTQIIDEAIGRELDRWQPGQSFALAPRMQAVTLDVIMAGIFGIDGKPRPGSLEFRLRNMTRRLLGISTHPAWQLVELSNLGREEPRGVLKMMMDITDRHFYPLIRDRRRRGATEGEDVMALLLRSSDDDRYVRDELLTLVLAGHETTANSLAWTVERLTRTPEAYARLRETARAGDESYVEATVHEGMRVRPVIPMVARLVQRPWQLGDFVVPAGTPVGLSIVGMHHREDVYPEPFAFRPDRFLDRKPGTYTWIPFGGGVRRCLGAALAMAEQRIVLREIARRVDLAAPDPAAERGRQRNVTMIPHKGGRVTVTAVQ
jgi:cytochrome P450